MSIPHQIHKTLCTREHATSAFCQETSCQNFSSRPHVARLRVCRFGPNHGHFFREILSELSTILVPFRKNPAPRLARSESVTIYEEAQLYSASALALVVAWLSGEGRGASLIINTLTSVTGLKRVDRRETGLP